MHPMVAMHACACSIKSILQRMLPCGSYKTMRWIAEGIPWHEVADHQSLHLRHDMHKMHHTDSNHGGMALSIPKHEQLTFRLEEKELAEDCEMLSPEAEFER